MSSAIILTHSQPSPSLSLSFVLCLSIISTQNAGMLTSPLFRSIAKSKKQLRVSVLCEYSISMQCSDGGNSFFISICFISLH